MATFDHLVSLLTPAAAQPKETTIHVQVLSMAGASLDLDLSSKSTFEHFRLDIAHEWRVPTRCQKLIQDGLVMDYHDSCTLEGKLTGDSIMLVVSLESVIADIEANVQSAWQRAARDLTELGHRAAGAVGPLCGMILKHTEIYSSKFATYSASQGHEGFTLVLEGLEVLGHIASRADENDIAVSTALTCVKHEDYQIRCIAIQALAKISERGRQEIVLAICDCFHDAEAQANSSLKEAIVAALGDLASPGECKSISIAMTCIKSESWGQRRAALATLGKLVGHGDEETVSAICTRLGDGDVRVRKEAFVALGKVGQGRKHAIDEVKSYLSHSLRAIRQSALLTLGELAARGDSNTLEAVMSSVEDPGWDVRQAAVQSLGLLAERGDENVLRAVRMCLQDDDSRVKVAAVSSLGQIAVPNDQEVLGEVRAHLEDASSDMRQAAVSALGKLAEPNDEILLSAVCARLGDESTAVRLAAVGALQDLVQTADGAMEGQAANYVIDALTGMNAPNVLTEWDLKLQQEAKILTAEVLQWTTCTRDDNQWNAALHDGAVRLLSEGLHVPTCTTCTSRMAIGGASNTWSAEDGQQRLLHALHRLDLSESHVAHPNLDRMGRHEFGAEKHRVKQELKRYDAEFRKQFGRLPSHTEKEPMRPLYVYYRRLKTMLAQVEQSRLGRNSRTGVIGAQRSQESLTTIPDMDETPHAGKKGQDKEDQISALEVRIENLQSEKAAVRAKLQTFQEKFVGENNRKIRFHKDILPIEREYRMYKNLKEDIEKAEQQLRHLRAEP